jgi:hypothetical protein
MSRREAVSSADMPGVPGNSGLIFGDILGNSAGETWTDPVDRFRLLRAESCGVFLAEGPVEPGRSCGLWLAEEMPEGRAVVGEGTAEKLLPLPRFGSICSS